MEDNVFPWKKITLREALSLDEETLSHCLYAFHDHVNWLYIGISHRLTTRLYQHLGIATSNGERLMEPEEAVHLLTENYGVETLADPTDFFWYLDSYYAIYTGVTIQNLGLAIMNNRPQCLEWRYYYAPIQLLYPNAEGAELDKLLASEEKKLIMQHRPLFNKRHNKQSTPGEAGSIWERSKRGIVMESSTEDKERSMREFPAFKCLLNEGACLYIDAVRLIEATDFLCRRTSQFEDRARHFEDISQEEIQEFVFAQAKALVGAGARALDLDDVLEVLMRVYGYDKVVMMLKWYEEGKRLEREDNARVHEGAVQKAQESGD
jgi:hypothetical protein